MYIPHARIKLGATRPVWFGGNSKRRRVALRKLKWYEFIRMPYLVPNAVASFVGFIVICSGAILCYVGYNPAQFFSSYSYAVHNYTLTDNNTTRATLIRLDKDLTHLKSLAYIGPVLMGVGFFILIVAVVLYCEIRDKFVESILPKRNLANTRKSILYDMVIEEFRKNYFRGIEVPIKPNRKRSHKVASELPTLYKALSVSTPTILITPEVQNKWTNGDKITTKHKRRRCLSDSETWLKTSSLPNIRPKSFRRLQRRFAKHSKFTNEKNETNKIELENKGADINENIEANNVTSDTCFSNPAFHGSPTEPVNLEDIITDFSNKHQEENKLKTRVLVHNEAIINGIDTRELIERRHSHIGNIGARVKDNNDNLNGQFLCVPDIYPADDSLTKKNKGAHKSFDHFDFRRRGPYKTCIGIVKSESSLCKIRHLVQKFDHVDIGDASSLDSLTLNEETMTCFEPTETDL